MESPLPAQYSAPGRALQHSDTPACLPGSGTALYAAFLHPHRATPMLQHRFQSPVGPLQVDHQDGVIHALSLARTPEAAGLPLLQLSQPGWAECLQAYFDGALDGLQSLPIQPRGTPFQQQVWQAVRAIPAGQTRAYGQLAALLGRPAAARAVGQALRRNPILLATPCHRVLPQQGGLGGFAGPEPELQAIKAFLLWHEGCLPQPPAGFAQKS